jgi:hypothetical protein
LCVPIDDLEAFGTADAVFSGELGCGSAVTCWRRLRDWQQAGVWDGLHLQVLDALGEQGLLDWSRTVIDSVAARAKGGELTGRNPVDRGFAQPNGRPVDPRTGRYALSRIPAASSSCST